MFRYLILLFLIIFILSSCVSIRNCSLHNVLSSLSLDEGEMLDVDSIVHSIDLCNELKTTVLLNTYNSENLSYFLRNYRCCAQNNVLQFYEIDKQFDFEFYMPQNKLGPWVLARILPTDNLKLLSKFNVNNCFQNSLIENINIFKQDSGYLVLFSSNVWLDPRDNKRYYSTYNDYVSILSPNLYAYDRGIRLLWNNYRTKIFWDLHSTSDTIFLNIDRQYKEKVPKSGIQYYKLHSNTIRPILIKEMKNGGNLQKSYFNLILWDLYQPQDFRIINNYGRVRVMKFYSPIKNRHYKVKFNIDYPFCFKVRKTIFS